MPLTCVLEPVSYARIPGSGESEEVPLGQTAWANLSVNLVIRFVQEMDVWVPRCSFVILLQQ